MENNRYREEEKELEETVQSNEEVAEEVEDIVQDVEEIAEEKTSKNKKNDKLKQQIKNLEEQNQALNAKIIELSDLLLRNQAELENFKRRTYEERIKERKYAMQDFFSEIIDLVDVFDKAVSIKTDDEKLKKFLSGFAMINARLKQTLESYGVSKIEALNKSFDPTYHQALETVEVEGVEANIIVEVVMEGYIYKDRILRPSMVKVTK